MTILPFTEKGCSSEALIEGIDNTLQAIPASVEKLEPSPGQNSREFIALQIPSATLIVLVAIVITAERLLLIYNHVKPLIAPTLRT